jgi:hypothetical protein
MMSMETDAGLTFMDIAPMLKINELEDALRMVSLEDLQNASLC